MKIIFLILLISFSMAACFGKLPFQPPAREYETWAKEGVGSIDTQMALLECGYPDPFNSGRAIASEHEIVVAGRCLMNDGFKYVTNRNWWSFWCPSSVSTRDKACAVDYVPEKRSVQKRLNSPYCIKYKNAPACKS